MADITTKGRNTPRRGPSLHTLSGYLKDGYQVAEGTLIALEVDGYVVSAGAGSAVTILGVFDLKSGEVLAQGLSPVGDGTSTQANRVDAMCGIFDFDNYATHPVVQASIGATGYAKDNHTISVNSGDGIAVGKITFLNGDGSVSIEVGLASTDVE
jgi:hypothetical protein